MRNLNCWLSQKIFDICRIGGRFNVLRSLAFVIDKNIESSSLCVRILRPAVKMDFYGQFVISLLCVIFCVNAHTAHISNHWIFDERKYWSVDWSKIYHSNVPKVRSTICSKRIIGVRVSPLYERSSLPDICSDWWWFLLKNSSIYLKSCICACRIHNKVVTVIRKCHIDCAKF